MEKNGKKAGRPKINDPKDIKITIRVTSEENKRIEIIAKKLDVKKTELIRMLTLGTDNKSPKNIYHQHKSFYPFLEGYLDLIGDIKKHDLDTADVIGYDEYKVTLIEDNIISHFNQKYINLKITNCRFSSIKNLFNDDLHYLINYNISTIYEDSDSDLISYKYNSKTYKPNELKEYLLKNDSAFKEIKNIDENEAVILLFGRRLNLLAIVPYEQEFSMGIDFEPLSKKD